MKTILFFQTGQPVIARRKLAGVTAFARTAGWHVVTAEKTSRPFDVVRRIRAAAADGCVAECSGPHAELDPATFGRVPVAFLCHDPARTRDRAACVTNDSPAIARLAVETLAAAGVRTLGFVGWHEPVYWSDNKRTTFVRLAEERGGHVSVFPPSRANRTDELLFRRRLAAWLADLPKPCGVYAVLDDLAVQVIEACRVSGISVPQDVSVLGTNDDEALCESCVPTLSSIRLDYERTGYLAATTLDRAFSAGGSTEGAFTVAPVGVTARQSTRRLAQPDPEVSAALEYIRAHYRDGITARDVAARFTVSRRPAEIRFKCAVGRTFDEEILHERLAAACRLLVGTSTSTSAVANLCGWRSETLFRRQFKRATGFTPTTWRTTIHGKRKGQRLLME